VESVVLEAQFENFARRFKVAPGDRISLTTARGDREFEGAAVIVD